MKNRIAFLSLMAMFSLTVMSGPALADKYEDTIAVFNKSKAVQPFFKNCYGYAVFPAVGKAGIGVGGSYGTGQVYRGGKVTGEARLIKATFGFQLGAQAKASYHKGIVVFTHAKGGLIYEAAIGGQKFSFKPNKQ
jgi:hypothetical protein